MIKRGCLISMLESVSFVDNVIDDVVCIVVLVVAVFYQNVPT